jgi:hypothetical protein
MHYNFVQTLDALIRNALEEKIFEQRFTEALLAMTPDDIEELPAKMVERFRSISESLDLKDQFVPSILQANQFVNLRLCALGLWDDDEDVDGDEWLDDGEDDIHSVEQELTEEWFAKMDRTFE